MDNSNQKDKTDITEIDEDDIATIKKKINKSEITVKEAIKKYRIRSKHVYYASQKSKKLSKYEEVFTKEQEKALKDHIIKCSKVQYNITLSTMRSMTYEYAVKLPGCKYPKKWDDQKMAAMEWFKRFRARHTDLRSITKKKKNSCICIMGCHMGAEGKTKLKKLEARVLIARVYHYLHKEYEYMKMSNDLSLLINILRRTAEATGVCEQTITSILDEEHKIQHSLDEDGTPAPDVKVPRKRKKNDNIMSEHDYTNKTNSDYSGESSQTDSSNKDSNTEINEISNDVVNSDLDTNMDTTRKDTNTESNDDSNGIPTDFNSNVDQTVIEDSTSNNSDNMVYTNIESNVNSIVEVRNTENIPAYASYSDFDSNMNTIIEVSDSESDEMAYSSVYSDFERLQQDASLIKSIQVEILEDDDEQKVKAEPTEATMEVALVDVEPDKQNEKSFGAPTMEVALVEVKTTKPAVTANGTMKVALFTVEPKEVPNTEERKSSQEKRKNSENKEVSIYLEDDNNDDDNTFDIQQDPRSILRSTRSLFYTSKYYSNKLKKVGTPINRLNDNYL